MVFAVSTEMFDEIVQHGKTGHLVVVEFFAPWCQACKALYPKFIQIAEHNPDVTFVKVSSVAIQQPHPLILQYNHVPPQLHHSMTSLSISSACR